MIDAVQEPDAHQSETQQSSEGPDARRAPYESAVDALAPGRDVGPGDLTVVRSLDCCNPDEFVPYLMPLVDARTGRWVGAEALSRWNHPVFGTLTPAEYLPIVRDQGLMLIHDRLIAASAIEQVAPLLRDARRAGRPFDLHVNMTAAMFSDPALPGWVAEQGERNQIDLRDLTIELVESDRLNLTDRVREVIGRLGVAGTDVVLDDFGTCFSGLSYLSDELFSGLKIDACFLRSIDGEPTDRQAVILEGVIALAHDLGMRTVCEGVETDRQRMVLQTLGCDVLQGYLYSPPIPRVEFAKLIRMQPGSDLSALDARYPDGAGPSADGWRRPSNLSPLLT